MAGIIQSPANLPITLVMGADFALGLTITESAVPYPWSGAVVTTSIVNSRTGAVNATNWTFTPGADGAATMTLTDTNTAALGVGTFDYYVQVTKSGTTTPWLGGQLSIRAPWETAVSAMTVNLSITTGSSVTLTVATPGVSPTSADAQYSSDRLIATGGESVFDRTNWVTSNAASSQQLRLGGFKAAKTETISQIRVVTGGTAAAATPTLCRLAVYERQADGSYSSVASTVNDTTLFAAANTTYNKSFSASFTKTAGTEYLVGYLIVTAVALPTFSSPGTGWSTAYITDVLRSRPIQNGVVTGQADLPATITSAAGVAATGTFHALLLP